MTAVSAFAPTGRNVFLRRYPAQGATATYPHRLRGISVAVLLLAIKFWKHPTLQRWRQCAKEFLEKRLLLAGDDGCSNLQERISLWLSQVLSALSTAVSRQRRLVTSRQLNASHNDTESDLVSVIRRNQTHIQSVLDFWFGQYAPDVSQKKLWMIAASSATQRDTIDQEITHHFESLLSELHNGLWKDWCDDTELYGYRGKVAAIVVMDQFSRHIHRYYENLQEQHSLPSVSQLDPLAYRIAQLFVKNHASEVTTGCVPLPMYIFALLPYRHANTLESVQYVSDCIPHLTTLQSHIQEMISRFRKATHRRLAVLQDTARRTGGGHSSTTDFTDEDILETLPFAVDMTASRNHVVHKTIVNFLAQQKIYPEEGPTRPVLVSLSGGVDSMVIASVLAHLKECRYNLNIVAIHIDYANRPESKAEADYVKAYCERLGIDFFCRRIDEVTRGVTARNDYERTAREARYGFYRERVQECCREANSDDLEIGVMLGHHRGDLRENVLSNSHKGCGPLDLSGMTAVSRNDGVVIYRPLLALEKTEIFDYAHTFGIPYFKDTTPHWSTRGKLRNKLLPLLEEIYGEGSMNNLSTLATESDEARDLLVKAVLKPFLDQVEHKPMGITFATFDWKSQGLFFWKFVLREALHSAGLGMFSDKSVVAFLERIQVEKVKAGWLQCRRDYAVFLDEHGRVFVFFPDSFPFRKSDRFDCIGKVVPYGKDCTISVGPWKITAEIVSTTELPHETDSLLERKAVSSMEEVMGGYIKYYIKAQVTKKGGAPQPLVIVSEFTRQTRPRAWKGLDLKLQEILPILGNDSDVAQKELVDESDWCLVRVTLAREGGMVKAM